MRALTHAKNVVRRLAFGSVDFRVYPGFPKTTG